MVDKDGRARFACLRKATAARAYISSINLFPGCFLGLIYHSGIDQLVSSAERDA